MPRTGAWRALFVAALLIILWLALRTSTDGPDWFDHADKLRHASAFAVLWWIGHRAGGRGWGLAIGLVAFGVLIEGLQSLTPHREATLADVLADAVGVALGAVWTRRR